MNKNLPDLGKLERVELRDAWPNEASHFTPWLALPENLRLLGETLGIALELEAQEKDVGPFRADILCRDIETDDWVLIENQLARTDHTHLGQLMTYAAGLRAVTVIWVARKFTEEHRAALDWLNGITSTEFNFFGLEVELWKIGDSEPAPKFNIVSKPNDWSKTVGEVASRSGMSAAKQTQLEFWIVFREYLARQETKLSFPNPRPHYALRTSFGIPGVRVSAIASFWDSESESFGSHEVRAELALTGSTAGTYYGHLESQWEAIEAELGSHLFWLNTPDAVKCRIYQRLGVADLHDKEHWPELHEWLREHLEAFIRVFGARLQAAPE